MGGKSVLHWSEKVTLHGLTEMGPVEEISSTLAVEHLDEMLLDVLEAIVPCLHEKTSDKSRKRHINAATETLKSARAARVRATKEEAWMKDVSCLRWQSCAAWILSGQNLDLRAALPLQAGLGDREQTAEVAIAEIARQVLRKA